MNDSIDVTTWRLPPLLRKLVCETIGKLPAAFFDTFPRSLQVLSCRAAAFRFPYDFSNLPKGLTSLTMTAYSTKQGAKKASLFDRHFRTLPPSLRSLFVSNIHCKLKIGSFNYLPRTMQSCHIDKRDMDPRPSQRLSQLPNLPPFVLSTSRSILTRMRSELLCLTSKNTYSGRSPQLARRTARERVASR